VAGVLASHSVTISNTGNFTLTATRTTGGTQSGTSNSFTVQPGAAVSLAVSGLPNPYTASSSSNVTVTALDAFGNIATGYLGTVHFTSTDPLATLPGDYTFQAGDGGTHTFVNGVTLVTIGEQTVTATDTVAATITGSQTVTVQ
jgi:hypothetical protein